MIERTVTRNIPSIFVRSEDFAKTNSRRPTGRARRSQNQQILTTGSFCKCPSVVCCLPPPGTRPGRGTQLVMIAQNPTFVNSGIWSGGPKKDPLGGRFTDLQFYLIVLTIIFLLYFWYSKFIKVFHCCVFWISNSVIKFRSVFRTD